MFNQRRINSRFLRSDGRHIVMAARARSGAGAGVGNTV